MDIEAAETEVQNIMEIADTDLNGRIDYSEFISATIDKKMLLSKESLKAAFQIFDKVSYKNTNEQFFQDGDGFISP